MANDSITSIGTTNRLNPSSDPNLKDAFWDYADIKKDNWNKSFPYRLAVYQRNDAGTWTRDNIIPPFTLPIGPESLQISTPFAIVTTPTLGGIIEEHNGAPLRTISLTGTTGVLPKRNVVNEGALSNAGLVRQLTGVFAGTSRSIGNLINSATKLGGINSNSNVISQAELDSGMSLDTGYYQFQLLARWFESYIALKKTTKGRNYVMAFEAWKDDGIFLVSPLQFDTVRSATNPLDYRYNIQLRAWKRVRLAEEAQGVFKHNPVARDPNVLAKVLNALNGARQVVEDSKDVLRSIRADVDNILVTPIREAALFCKEALGVAVVASDLPAQIILDFKDPILEAVSVKTFFGLTGQQLAAFPQKVNAAFSQLAITTNKAISGAGVHGSHGVTASPADKILSSPGDYYDFFSAIKPNTLNLRPQTVKKVSDERARVAAYKREQFEKYRNNIKTLLADFENAVGIGNATFNATYGTGRVAKKTPTDRDYEISQSLTDVVTQLSRLAASSTINQNEVNSIDYFAGLATRSGIAFTTPRSKYLVPFPYGHTLERLAEQYLGSPDRWNELVALNGLMEPYVDEEGFQLPLLSNGNTDSVFVSDATNLYVGQTVWIGSSTVGRTKRHISKISKLANGTVLVSVDGNQDLAQYTTVASAYLQAFLPNTINSQMSIWIPSDTESSDDDFRGKHVPGIDYFDELVRAGGIDFLLTQDGDLVLTPNGNIRWAAGLTNIVQKVRLAIETQRGSILGHEEYGFPVRPGSNTAEFTAKDLLEIVKDLFKGDPTFSGVQSASILKDGPIVQVTFGVGIAGTSRVIPITVDIPR